MCRVLERKTNQIKCDGKKKQSWVRRPNPEDQINRKPEDERCNLVHVPTNCNMQPIHQPNCQDPDFWDTVFVSQTKLVTSFKKRKSDRHSAHRISPKISIFADKSFSSSYNLARH